MGTAEYLLSLKLSLWNKSKMRCQEFMTFKVINSLVLVVWWQQKTVVLRFQELIDLVPTLLVVLKLYLKFYLNQRSCLLNSIQKHTTWFYLQIIRLRISSSSSILLFCSLLTIFLNLLRWWTFNLGGIRASFIWMVKR